MCGRYYLDDTADLCEIMMIQNYIRQRFGKDRAKSLKSGEIFPSNEVPVLLTAEADPYRQTAIAEKSVVTADGQAERASSTVVRGDSQLIAVPMVWGFPGFKAGQIIINARQETLSEKAVFSDAYEKRRCVIPTTGFFEWSHDDKGKAVNKYLFNIPGTRLLYLAAIFTVSASKLHFAIITTAANSSMSDVHNRQPLIVPGEMIRPWIDDPEAAFSLCQSEGPDMLKKLI